MAVTYRTSLKTTRMTDVKTDIDSGGAAGSIEIGTTGMGTVLASLPLSYPCGTVTTGVLTLSAITSATASNTGTAAEARIKNSSGTAIVTGLTVGTSGANINLNTTSITSGGTVSLSSGTITHG